MDYTCQTEWDSEQGPVTRVTWGTEQVPMAPRGHAFHWSRKALPAERGSGIQGTRRTRTQHCLPSLASALGELRLESRKDRG